MVSISMHESRQSSQFEIGTSLPYASIRASRLNFLTFFWYKNDEANPHHSPKRKEKFMHPAVFFIGRALLVALVGALATVIVNRFDKMNQDKNDYHYHEHPGWDEHEDW